MWNYFSQLINQVISVDSRITILVILIILTIILIDILLQRIQESGKTTGIKLTKAKTDAIVVDSSKSQKVRTYKSEKLGLVGTPDAIIHEGGYVIPIEHKPLASKLRDRYVAQLMVYLKLIEEVEGQRPPYGYLILGPKARRVKISNTRQRQDWIDKILQEMRSIIKEETLAKADPHPQKCSSCRVKEHCEFKILA